MKKDTSLYLNYKDMSNLIDTSNNNNHAGIKRMEASEKAEAVLKVINDYRMYTQRFESLPTWDVLEFLSKLQKELFKSYEEELVNSERDRLREEYFLQVWKKPFLWWSAEQIKEELEKFREGLDTEYKSSNVFRSVKSQRKWARKK